MGKNKDAKSSPKSKQNVFYSVKGKFLLMGIMGIVIALLIGVIGVSSINRNAKSSDVVALVNDISLLQAQNISNDALYQYYVDESYLNDSLSNLDQMEQKANQLKKEAGISYAASANSIIENVEQDKANYTELLSLSAERGYSTEVGKFQEYMNDSAQLSESFGALVNNNDWVEITWTQKNMSSGQPVTVDGKNYLKFVYDEALPVVGKRDGIAIRMGGGIVYHGEYFVKNVALVNGSDSQLIDLSAVEELQKSGDGLVDAAISEFGGEPAIQVTGNYNAAADGWNEVSTQFSVEDYDMEKYPDLRYEIYLDADAVSDIDFKYGGAVTGVYAFAGNLTTLDELTEKYSKLVVEGKDVTEALGEVEALMTEIETRIPKYTTDPSLAEASLGFLSAKKAVFDEMKATDERALAIKADNAQINASLTELCEKVLTDASKNMNRVKNSVTVLILIVLVLGIVLLAGLLGRVSLGIDKSVSAFSSAIDQIAAGKISTRANATGKDEFAMFSHSLNSFMDTLEKTVTKVKGMTNVLADSGVALEESANKSKEVASNINDTIRQISDGAVEQARDVENSSQRVIDIRENINQIFGSVSTLSAKSDEMGNSGREVTDRMTNLTKSSDQTTEAFTRIAEQVRKTDESVGEIQQANSLIQSVASQINLLSLNASIEAARAGDAGKGFAVVATEISKLADQTNQSAATIEKVIQELSQESTRTVENINEVTELIQAQKNDIDSTYEIMSGVRNSIQLTLGSVTDVLVQAESSEASSQTVVDLMTNLSAISEENAASAETTSSAMAQLNTETERLADTSSELKKIADTLKEDLDFFQI